MEIRISQAKHKGAETVNGTCKKRAEKRGDPSAAQKKAACRSGCDTYNKKILDFTKACKIGLVKINGKSSIYNCCD
jgi:hypothetical protein